MKPKSCKNGYFSILPQREWVHNICRFDLNATSKLEAINVICILYKIAILFEKGGR